MTYAYVRVSTDKQQTDNQRFEIERFCLKNGIVIDEWIDETISGTKDPKKRLLGSLINKSVKDDLIICSELSRLGRSLFMIMSLLNDLMKKEVRVWTIKDNYRLGNDVQSKVLAFAFALSAEIERDLISQRIKEALARRKAGGIKLGRPVGKKPMKVKLTGHEEEIKTLLEKKVTISNIARILGVNRMTVNSFMARAKIEKKAAVKKDGLVWVDGKAKCRICGEMKTEEEYYMKTNGLRTWAVCKECTRKKRMENYEDWKAKAPEAELKNTDKYCPGCGEIKPISEFHFLIKGKGRRSRCMECHKKENMEYQRKKKEAVK
jgi:DNA invertase Pin-like site-specific DNA recombinase